MSEWVSDLILSLYLSRYVLYFERDGMRKSTKSLNQNSNITFILLERTLYTHR